MKILYHHRTASKDGQAVHIEEMIEALRALGHEVRVVAPMAEDQSGQGQMGSDMGWVHKLKALMPKALYELMELAYSWVAYRKLMQAARDFQPDVIYERYNLFLLSGLMAARRLKAWRAKPGSRQWAWWTRRSLRPCRQACASPAPVGWIISGRKVSGSTRGGSLKAEPGAAAPAKRDR